MSKFRYKVNNLQYIKNNNMIPLIEFTPKTQKEEIIKIMKILIISNYNIVSLSFTKCNIGINSIFSINPFLLLGSFLSTTQTLESLSITYDNINLDLLAEIIMKNTTLTELDLTNSISDSSYDKFITMLETNTNITKLNLSCNYLYNYTFLLLNKMLKINNTITDLIIRNVSYCEFLYYGRTQFIMDAITKSNTLKKLDMSNNYFDDGIDSIISHMIQYNKCITTLDFSYTNMNINEIDIIINSMKDYNTSITKINLQQTDINSYDMYNIICCLEKRNIAIYNRKLLSYWNYPMDIILFGGKHFYNIIITVILCNNSNIIKITNELLIYIFEFFTISDVKKLIF